MKWIVVTFFYPHPYCRGPAVEISFRPERSIIMCMDRHTCTGSDKSADRKEMTALDAAFRDIVSAVALGDTEKVHRAIESLHGIMEKTREDMHAGTVTLPENAARIKEFTERDAKFHEKLDALDRATRRKNQREMLRITKQLLDGCVQCHQNFRK